MSLALARFLLALLTTAIAYRRPALRTTALALAYVACCDIAASSLHGRAASVAWAVFPLAAVWLASPRAALALLAPPLALALAPRGWWPAHPDAYATVVWLPHLLAPSAIAWALMLKDEGPGGHPSSPSSAPAARTSHVPGGFPATDHFAPSPRGPRDRTTSKGAAPPAVPCPTGADGERLRGRKPTAHLSPAQAVAVVFAASGAADIIAGAGQAGVSAVARALRMPFPDSAPWSLAAPMSWATLAAVALVVARATRRV